MSGMHSHSLRTRREIPFTQYNRSFDLCMSAEENSDVRGANVC